MIRNSDMYAGDFQFTTALYGTEAVQQFGSLTVEKSIEANCRYPRNGELKLSLGRSEQGPFVFVRDSKGDHCFLSDHDEQKLFSVACRFLDFRQSFVNSDPRVNDFFQSTLDAREMAAAIEDAFASQAQL